MKKQSYQILGVGIALESDSEHLLELFATDYAWFETQTVTSPKTLTIAARLHNGQQPACLRINEDTYPLADHPNPGRYSYQIIVKRLMGELDDFLLLHAGVVAKDAKALIIAGLPGSGKTTLVTELLKSGFAYFSDDICPIHHETGLVHPFPRALWQVLPGHPAGGCKQSSGTASKRESKAPLGVDTLAAPSGGKPCRARMLICLDPGNHSLPYFDLEIGLKADGAAVVIKEFQELPGVVAASMQRGPFEWRVRIPKAQRLTGEVRGILTKYARQIWNVYRVDQVAPEFEAVPTISPMPLHEAAFRLLRDLKREPTAVGNSGRFGSSPGALFAGVSQLLGGTACYRLSPGPRELMGELVAEVWKANLS